MSHPRSNSLPPTIASPYQAPPSYPSLQPPVQPRRKSGFARVFGVILVLLLAGVGIVALIKSQMPSASLTTGASEPSVQVSPQQLAPTRDLVATHKARLISAIRLADQAEIESQRTLDPRPLYNVYQGEALKSELAQIQSLKSNGVFVDSRLEKQQFQSFKVSDDEKHAEVRVVETWSSTVYSLSTQECLNRIPRHDAPQTILLEHGENGWLVDAINHDRTGSDIEPVPCNTSAP
jgi:hypothetical protein